MQFDVPDPAVSGSAQAQRRFRRAATIAFAFVALLWILYAADAALDLDPDRSGIQPRQWSGLPGIVFAPLVHAGFDHLVSNSAPLLVLVTAMFFLYPGAVPSIVPAVWLGPGIAVWLFGRDSVHFGASGLVYGLATYVFVAGLLRRDRRAIATSLAVWFLYGSLVWGVLPVPSGVSWETHLSAALIALAMAIRLRRLDVPPRKRYVWEDEAHDEAGVVLPPGDEPGPRQSGVNPIDPAEPS